MQEETCPRHRSGIKILKVRFDKVTLEQATERVMKWLKQNKQRYITTPNPEFLLEAQKNPEFLKILNKSDMNIPDGTGILWAAKYLKITKTTKNKIIKILKWFVSIFSIPFYPKYIRSVLSERVTGADLMEKICKKCANTGTKIFLLGGREGVAEKVKEIMEKRYPKQNIAGLYGGTPALEEEKGIVERINKASPDILFVAYGAPNQEIWMTRNLKKMKSVKIAMGVGGTFNFIAGTKKRAPRWMQRMGIEWLFRLAQEPSRIKRIYNAIIKFPLKVLGKSLRS